jgi:hypothetical protein
MNKLHFFLHSRVFFFIILPLPVVPFSLSLSLFLFLPRLSHLSLSLSLSLSQQSVEKNDPGRDSNLRSPRFQPVDAR